MSLFNLIENSALCCLFPQSCNSDMTIIAFLIFPTRTNNFNVESLRGQAIAKQLKDTVSSVQNQIGRRLFDICLRWICLCWVDTVRVVMNSDLHIRTVMWLHILGSAVIRGCLCWVDIVRVGINSDKHIRTVMWLGTLGSMVMRGLVVLLPGHPSLGYWEWVERS